jgi:hypothetical protein
MRTKLHDVERARIQIRELQHSQNQVYEKLVENLGWDNDYLFDYLFNCSESDEDYTKLCQENILQEINGN